jgi:hypothetical protein
MKLYVDHYCEIADMLAHWSTEQFYGFERLTIEPGATYVVGRTQLKNNAEQIRRLVTEKTARVIFSNPAEGSETFVQHLRLYGVEDLVLNGLLPVVVGGPVPDTYPHMLYEHFLTQPFRYEENCQAADRINEIFNKKVKPYRFLFLNGRSRPHRRALINAFEQRGLLAQALWTNLDTHAGPVHLLPPEYEVEQFQSFMQTSQQGFVKTQLFNNLWGEIYIRPEPYIDTYFSVVTETVFDYAHSFRTEKIAKPLCQGHPWIAAANAGFYKDMHNLGFQTFGHVIDESFDTIDNAQDRINRIVTIVDDLCGQDLLQLLAACESVCKYNQQHLREMSQRWQLELPSRFFDFLAKHP